ncbi:MULTISPECIES: hypothetical protein [Candidatus Phytoplasma]|uniref:Uncharacterized protein n=1 Tax=Maize bushy stunt phytoplasma TaxID=202462 RepID=A0ABN4S139_9MOLU|nr:MULTISPECIES: hypothetical protein [Phytoplasma]AOF54761.1 hypothetical protein MBSPM3_v1c2420 [Maize bushy stunt phytoplasma]OIJ44712.1 hypothetical protein BHE82_02185 [Rice orange leaf phytoplasma]
MKTNKNNKNNNKKKKKQNNNDLKQSNKYNNKTKLTKDNKNVKSNKKGFNFSFSNLLAWGVVVCLCSIPLYYISATVWEQIKK